MGKLNDWTQKTSKYLKLQDGEEVKVFFKGYKFVNSSFDSDKETVRYTLDTPFGEKFWDTSAKNVANFLDDVAEGEQVLIKRKGTGTDTKYDLSLVEADSE
jgi:hypothetical protein